MNKIQLTINNIITCLGSSFNRRDEKIALFGAWFGNRFADNSRFLFQFLSEHKDAFGLEHVVWVTNKKEIQNELNENGYECYLMNSEESIKYHKRAKWHIICNSSDDQNGDILCNYSYGAYRINLWHGTGGLKAVYRGSNEYKRRRRNHITSYFLREMLENHSSIYRKLCMKSGGWGLFYQVTTSSTQTALMKKSYGIFDSMFIETGYPRNCPCPRLLANEERILSEMQKYKAVVLYLPTFRTGTNYRFDNLAHELDRVLKMNNILWIEKPHSIDQSNNIGFSIQNSYIRLNSDFDINVLIPYISLLVTDYSSVRMDAMYHNKATLFYVPDFEEYLQGDNGFSADPNEVMCGPKLFNVNELRDAIERYAFDPEASKTDNYYKIRTRYWSHDKSLEEIWKDITNAVKYN